jgi:uncharacterized protein YihD (DUF1040 family)
MRKTKLSPEILSTIKKMNKGLKPRDPKRIPEVLDALKKIWKKYPDQRLGQLLLNFAFLEGSKGKDQTDSSIHAQEDDITLKNLQKIIKERLG